MSGWVYKYRTVVRPKSTSWGSYYVAGSDVDFTNNNSTNNTRVETVIAWSSNNGANTKWMTRTGTTTYSTVDNLSHNGSQVQICNGYDLAEMKGAVFNTEGLPYSIDRATTVFGGGPLAKTVNTDEPTFGRTGVVYKNGMEFVFFLGDIMLGEENILFVKRSDTLAVAGTSDLNDAMTTNSFQLNSNSELYFSVFYYVINTELADSVLTENDLVTFGVELVKADNNQVVGTFDNVVYGLNNLNEYDNIDYQVDYSGIESGSYFFRLVTGVEGDSELYLSNVQNDSELLAKKNYRTVKFDELLVPEEYALMQNYPNPFNPSTTIKYQLPKSGIVTIKIYDILGREVTTLVDEFKTEGRYEVNFSASSLASGVYLYRLSVNDPSTSSGQNYVDVKKMILLK